jgi:NAD(P)-dependent dehydrogenase (short-subunit alcohol dehydrogenase family)
VVTDLDHFACVDRAHSLGSRVFGHGADVTRPESLASLVAAVLDRFGQIDALVNSAAIDDKVGTDGDGRVETYSLAAWKRSLDVNVTGTFLTCQAFGSVMAQRGSGSIINIASTYGLVAPDQGLYRRPDGTQSFWKSPAYPTTKAAVLGLTRHLAAYWGADGVRVNALSPGGVEAGQDPSFIARYSAKTPLGRMAKAADYAGAVVYLASDASAYMTGANLVVDGGFTAW